MKTIHVFVLILFFGISTQLTHPMMVLKQATKLKTRTKKYFNECTIQKKLRQEVAQRFSLEQASPAIFNALLVHNEEQMNVADAGASLSLLVSTCSSLAMFISYIQGLPPYYSAPITAASLLGIAINIHKSCEHGRTIKSIKKSMAGHMSHANRTCIEARAHKDIQNNIKKLSIIPSKKESSIKHKEGNTTNWDINNIEILEGILDGYYNSSDYTLHFKLKE